MGDVRPIIEVENVSAGYGGDAILDGICAAVHQGDMLGVIGPNGAGKTTLLRVMAGIISPSSGHVRLDGADLAQVPRSEIGRRIAVMPQILSFTHAFRVHEIVAMGRYPHVGRLTSPGEEDIRVVEQAMELADVTGLADRNMDELSGGEIQRVFFAQALAQEPKVLLMDEPTAHLDIAHQVRILDLVRERNREMGLSVLMILHDLNLASEYCRRLILLDKGRVRAEGTPEEVIDYRIIEEVYKTVVVVERNPISGKPFVMVVSRDQVQSGSGLD